MRYRFCFALIVLLSTTVADAVAETASRVAVQPAMTRLVRTPADLRQICQVDGDFDACTTFVAFRLDATCVEENSSWRIEAQATFRPWIIMFNIRQLPHEQEHIRDIRGFAESYVAGLSEVSYASREQCSAHSLAASESFGATMRVFASRSTSIRHPQIVARAARLR